MHGPQCAEHLAADLGDAARGKRPLLLDQVFQRSRVEELHDDPGPVVLGDDVEDGDHRGVGHHGGRPGLALGAGAELGPQLLVEDQREAHLLDSHVTVEQVVVRTPDGAHAAAAAGSTSR